MKEHRIYSTKGMSHTIWEGVTDDYDGLNRVMEFDTVVQVTDIPGLIIERGDIHAPSLWDGEVDDAKKWALMTGYSGQDRYPGPIMHNSEFIGGGMARDILAEPGIYVVLVCFWTPEEGEENDDNAEGWAVAQLRETYDA